ncbi:cytochrome P450 [Thozetella sp. PMI_491]|nr:cytochrome P450 [Thozetella sp. PMI_491]
MLREVIYGLAGLIGLVITVDFLFNFQDDPSEPPRVHPKIPVLGHFLGLLRYGTGYSAEVCKETDAEIFTIGVFGFKIYVCNTRRLMPVIMKQSKTLSFRPFIQLAAKKFAGISDKAYDLLGGQLLDDFTNAQKHSLLPGPQVDEQNLRMGEQLVEDFESFFGGGWCRDVVVQASAKGVYGATHPFRDPEVDEAFWKWHTYVGMDLAGLELFTKEGRTARTKVYRAFEKYFAGEPKDAAPVVWERHRVQLAAGVPMEDVLRQDVTFPVAVFTNTTPTMYWTIWELFSRPDVLAEVRQELELHAVTGSKEAGFVMDVAAIKAKCPLLLSVMEETQRMRHVHAILRAVLSDTMLDGRYLLKKGNYLQMPGQPIHLSTEIWGPSAAEFDPYRFVPKKGRERDGIPPSAFLPWGAPPHLCPARQFASAEIMLAVGMLALRADLLPSSGRWEKNPALHLGDIVSVLPPKVDPDVKIIRREQWAGDWSLKMGEQSVRISLASG